MRGRIIALAWAVAVLAASASAEFAYEGQWGTRGSGEGQFQYPAGVAVTPDGAYVYVADTINHRIQYFYDRYAGVAPTSLGRVKALFK